MFSFWVGMRYNISYEDSSEDSSEDSRNGKEEKKHFGGGCVEWNWGEIKNITPFARWVE